MLKRDFVFVVSTNKRRNACRWWWCSTFFSTRYNSSWSLTHDAIADPGCSGTRFRIALKIAFLNCVDKKGKVTLEFLVQDFVILLADWVLALTQQRLADFRHLETFYFLMISTNYSHFAESDAAPDRGLKRAFSWPRAICTFSGSCRRRHLTCSSTGSSSAGCWSPRPPPWCVCRGASWRIRLSHPSPNPGPRSGPRDPAILIRVGSGVRVSVKRRINFLSN